MKSQLLLLPLLLVAGPALAADVILEQAPEPIIEQAPVMSWAGGYVGVQGGYGFGRGNGVFSMDRNQDGVFGDYIAAFDPTQPGCAGDNCGFSGDFDDGFVGGIHAGYDWQFDNIVLGGILDISATDIGDTQSGFSGTPAFYTIERDLDVLVTARLRAGYAFSDRFMAYATGGLAYGDVDTRFVSNTPAITTVRTLSDDNFGYTVGGGVVTKVTNNISLGFEYLYTDLGSNNVLVNLSGPAGSGAGNAFGTGGADSTNAVGSDDKFDFHTVTVKISYHF